MGLQVKSIACVFSAKFANQKVDSDDKYINLTSCKLSL
jgi:hypothetical protein